MRTPIDVGSLCFFRAGSIPVWKSPRDPWPVGRELQNDNVFLVLNVQKTTYNSERWFKVFTGDQRVVWIRIEPSSLTNVVDVEGTGSSIAIKG